MLLCIGGSKAEGLLYPVGDRNAYGIQSILKLLHSIVSCFIKSWFYVWREMKFDTINIEKNR